VCSAQEGTNLRGLSPQEADTVTQLDQDTVGNMSAYYECDGIVSFLAQYFLTEPRHGLLLTPEGMEHHLLLYINTCGQLVEKMEVLLYIHLPAAEKNKLDMLCTISHHNMLSTWPAERLHMGATTARVEGLLGELEEFETRRLDFLSTTKEILLEVCETLYNPRGTATATHTPRLVRFLDSTPRVTWIQFTLPEDLTLPRL